MDRKQITVGLCVGLGVGCIGGTLMNLYFAFTVAAISLIVAVVLSRKKSSVHTLVENAPPLALETIPEEQELLATGFRLLASLQYYRKTIKSLAMRQHLSEIVENTEGILQYAKKHPVVVLSIKRFFTYYLIETEGLIITYEKLSRKPEIDQNDYQVLKKLEETMGVAKVAAVNYHAQIKQDNIMDLEVHLEVFEREMRLDGVIHK